MTVGFHPLAAAGAAVTATSSLSINAPNGVCGPSAGSINLTGGVTHGKLGGWPQTGVSVDFGPVPCDGTAPAHQFIILSNTGAADAHVTSVSLTGNTAFTTDVAAGRTIPAGGALTITLTAPAVPMFGAPALTVAPATLALTTDVASFPPVTLTEEPQGAILAFPTTAVPGFGSVVLLEASTQPVAVTNTGNAPAAVTLSAAATGGGTSPFTVTTPTFTIGANGIQADSVSFSPVATGSATGTLAIQATGSVCAPLPPSLPLAGFGLGGGPSVNPTSLSFSAACGATTAPPSQSFTVSNDGTTNLVWAMSALTGPGKADYTLSASPAPGTLEPGQSSTVTVTAGPIASPAASPSPSAYAASVTVTTDVPFNQPHVVSLGETPLGDQLAFSVSSFRFGQIPIQTSTIPQTFTLVNDANAGSPAANLSLVVGGSGASAYSVAPNTVTNLGPSGAKSPTIGVSFAPSSPVAYPAEIDVLTTDAVCTPLPSPIALGGTGTQAMVAVSPNTLAFGSDPTDPKGLVDCGATGQPQTLTISNTGNQSFDVTALALGLGANSPYVLSGPGATLPAAVDIGQSTTLTITPNAIPSAVANPNDASAFSDTLTLTTDAPGDAPHRVSLVMQPRGAVIANTPLDTNWSFGTLAGGVVGTFSTTVTNDGNAPVSIAFTGLQHPTVFDLQTSPTIAAANAVTDVVGQFSPPAADQQFTDTGTLAVTAPQGLCEPLPASWNDPTISLSGMSISGNLPVTLSGTLAFPLTNCGSAAPAAQSITLTNTTSSPYVFTARLSSGAFYTLQNPTMGDAGAAVIAGNGVVVLGVTPQTVTPGQTAVAGAAAYADDLVIQIQSQPPSGITIPISWTLNGAMLSLPQGGGPNRDGQGNPFYAADTTSGLQLPIDNAGTATASVVFGLQQPSTFSITPGPTVEVQPGIEALPRLNAIASDAACPSLTPGLATILYSGPVCRPSPLTQVTVQSCSGTF